MVPLVVFNFPFSFPINCSSVQFKSFAKVSIRVDVAFIGPTQIKYCSPFKFDFINSVSFSKLIDSISSILEKKCIVIGCVIFMSDKFKPSNFFSMSVVFLFGYIV